MAEDGAGLPEPDSADEGSERRYQEDVSFGMQMFGKYYPEAKPPSM